MPPDVNRIPDAVPRDEPRSAFGNPPFYYVAGHRYVVLPSAAGYVERGVASWYGTEFHGLRTSTGEPYDMFAMTAAHKTLPLPCYARVTNLTNGRSVVVRINDRGPFVANRIIDLSYSAATRLDMIRNGTAFVQVEVLTPAAPSADRIDAGKRAGRSGRERWRQQRAGHESGGCGPEHQPQPRSGLLPLPAWPPRATLPPLPLPRLPPPRSRRRRRRQAAPSTSRWALMRTPDNANGAVRKLRAARPRECILTLAPMRISRCSACASVRSRACSSSIH